MSKLPVIILLAAGCCIISSCRKKESNAKPSENKPTDTRTEIMKQLGKERIWARQHTYREHYIGYDSTTRYTYTDTLFTIPVPGNDTISSVYKSLTYTPTGYSLISVVKKEQTDSIIIFEAIVPRQGGSRIEYHYLTDKVTIVFGRGAAGSHGSGIEFEETWTSK